MPKDSEEEFYEVRRQSPVLRIAAVFFAVFVAGGLYFGYIFVHTATNVVSAALSLDWAPLPPPILGPAVAIQPHAGDRVEPTPKPTVKPTDRPPLPGERVNILLLGLDQRDDERGNPSRSDTMILVTVDPVTKSGAMLSMPRDLWVAIPGYRDNKINVAHFLGEMDKLPGGGPALAKQTVELNFGVPVHYFVRVNFRAFEEVVDALGGVDIDVPKYIIDYEYPTENYGYMTVEFAPGMQHMDGVRALQYARTRHADSDFYRNKRQQQVLVAMRNKALRLDVLPKLPGIINALKDTVDTDIPMTAYPGLIRLASEVDISNIASFAIEPHMVRELCYGCTDLVPDREEIRKLMAQFYADPKIRSENAKVTVENGSTHEGLAKKMSDYIESKGYAVARVQIAGRRDFTDTVILDHTGTKKNTINGLAALLKVPQKNIHQAPPDGDTDISIVVGQNTAIPQQ